VPGMLKDKIQALLKSLPQRPRSRFVPLPESATRLAALLGTPDRVGHTGLADALLKQVRDETSLDVKRADFKLDMVPPHLFMNFRVVDEHGRQLGQGRNLGALKAELGAKARGAFQALASLKIAPGASPKQDSDKKQSASSVDKAQEAPEKRAKNAPAAQAEARYTAWTFGELPELMEIGKGGQTLIGFPALIDAGDAVSIEVFDEPEVAAGQAPRRPAPPVRAADQGRAQVPRKEHPRPAEDGRGLHAAGHAGRAARADHRRGAGPRLSARPAAHQCAGLRAPRAGGARPPDADRE
jgi:ATP-dependent helicase HrpA